MLCVFNLLNPPLMLTSQAHPPPTSSMPNLSNFLRRSSPSQPPQPSLESLESSVRNLAKLCERKQKWRTLFATAPRAGDGDTWRTHLVSFLESTPAHVVAISLLVMDLVVTALELSSSLVSCDSAANQKGAAEARYFHWVGIAILGLLSAKTVGLAVGLGGAFLKQPGCVVDGVVVVGALVLEVSAAVKGGGGIMVASLWRVVRVVESTFELSDEAIEEKMEGIVIELERVAEENRREKEIVMEKEKLIQMLQEQLNRKP